MSCQFHIVSSNSPAVTVECSHNAQTRPIHSEPMDKPVIQARTTCFNFNVASDLSALNQKPDPKPIPKRKPYHSHRAFNIKATLNRNVSLSTDLRHINPIQPCSPLPPRPKTSERAQIALSRHLRRIGTAPKSNCKHHQNSRHRNRRLYRENLSHVPYGTNTLNWEKLPEWELEKPQDIKFKHMAHRKVKQLWKERNMPNLNPIPSYEKLVNKALHIKSPKKRSKLKRYKSVQYLKPGPIFRNIHIYSSNSSNRSLAHKDEQIFIDIETRLRTHRPIVVLWPSEFYKQRHLSRRRMKNKRHSPRRNTLINRKNKKQRIEFQNTFTNSYLFKIERDSDYLYIPKQYDVEVSVRELAIGSKKWRAMFTINSHHFQSGIVPFTIKVRQISTNKAIDSKQHITNMTTDNSHVILKCNSHHHRKRKKKKKKRRKHSRRKLKPKRNVTTSRARSGSAKAKQRGKTRHDTVQQDEADESDVDSLVADFSRLKGSICDIQEMLCRTKVLGDGNVYHEMTKNEQQMIELIKSQILNIESEDSVQ